MYEVAGQFLSLLNSDPAYLDPGSGSMLLQLILAGLIGAGIAIRVFWRRILGIFGIKPKAEPSEENSEDIDPS